VSLAGVDVRDLADSFGTPLMLIDEADFRSRCRDFAAAFGRASAVHYAGKAFLCSEVVRWLDDEGLALDVCTAGELTLALRAGFPPERIALHGSNKSGHELEMALHHRIGAVVIDSFHEIGRLAGLVEQFGRSAADPVPVMVRATVGVEAHTHEFIATAHEDQKFGFSLAGGEAEEAVRRVAACQGLRLIGLHSHIGSQIFDPSGFEVAAHRVVGLLREIVREHPAVAEGIVTLDLGGGLGIAYTSQDAPLAVAEAATRLRVLLDKECSEVSLPVPRLAVEPGRAISGPTTVTLYEVGTVKQLPGLRTYVSVDGGMSDNIRPALYGARYTAALVSRHSDAAPQVVTVVGKHCESGDVVVHDVALPADLRPGDLVAVPASGAYHRSMANNYNHVPRPPVVAVRDGTARVIVRRETLEDLLRLDVEP